MSQIRCEDSGMLVVTKVREASWEAFAAIRQRAREDAFFAGCEAQKIVVDFVSTRPSFKRSSKTLRPSCSASIKLGGMLSVK